MESSNCWVLTGPNMGGKSTFLRQNALLVILAQVRQVEGEEKKEEEMMQLNLLC